MYDLYFDSEEEEAAHRNKWGLSEYREQNRHNKISDMENRIPVTPAVQAEKAHKYILRDLFLWAILTNRIEMAKVFLCFLKYRICPALIATKILKVYYKKAIYGEVKDKYEEDIKYFENYAINCLDECYKEDLEGACQLVVQQNELYGYVNCLQVCLINFFF